jgi:tRNA-Thr(GGU) m(6)t(6)A37 methyltransferase TsaA
MVKEGPAMALTKTRQARRPKGKRASKPAELRPVGLIRSTLKNLSEAPKQGSEGAPDAWLEVHAFALDALDGIAPGDDLLVITWLDQAHRKVLRVHPRNDPSRRLTGVFSTRSPDRPNPLGLHRVTVRKIHKNRLRIGPIEAIDGTPVVDIKPALSCAPHDER